MRWRLPRVDRPTILVSSGQPLLWAWDGRDDAGRSVSCGTNWVRAVGTGESVRLVLIR